jgi:hypothetical protein
MTYYYVVSAATLISQAIETANSPNEAAIVVQCTPPAAPDVTYNQPIYSGMALNLSAGDVAGGTYRWTGPNGFVSTSQNPVVASVTGANSGIYSVVAIVAGCDSAPATTTVTVNPPLSLSGHASNGSLVLAWPFGALQSATNLSGPWIELTGDVDTVTNAMALPREFFRLRLQ